MLLQRLAHGAVMSKRRRSNVVTEACSRRSNVSCQRDGAVMLSKKLGHGAVMLSKRLAHGAVMLSKRLAHGVLMLLKRHRKLVNDLR